MKAASALLSISIGLFLLSSCSKEASNKEQLLSSGKTMGKNNKESTQLTSVAGSGYTDDYPEWGTSGTNRPAPNTSPTYSATVEVYSLTGKTGSQTENFTNSIFINSSAGSNPYVNFKNFSTVNIYPTN